MDYGIEGLWYCQICDNFMTFSKEEMKKYPWIETIIVDGCPLCLNEGCLALIINDPKFLYDSPGIQFLKVGIIVIYKFILKDYQKQELLLGLKQKIPQSFSNKEVNKKNSDMVRNLYGLDSQHGDEDDF